MSDPNSFNETTAQQQVIAPPNLQIYANLILESKHKLLESLHRPLLQSASAEIQAEESKFDYLALSEEQMYKNLQQLQLENEKSIEEHKQVKAKAYKLRKTLVDSILQAEPESTTDK